MQFTSSHPLDANIPWDFVPAASCERRAALWAWWSSPEVQDAIHGKPKPKLSFKQSLKKRLEPITRPLAKTLEPITRPFVLSTSNPYPADTDVPVVRVAKKVARLGRPKKLRLMEKEKQRGLNTFPPSPLVHNPSPMVPPECYRLVETRKGYFVEKKDKRISGGKVKCTVARVCRRAAP